MKALPFFLLPLLFGTFAHADLADSCSPTDRTACPLNADANNVQYVVMLPNYRYCGVKFLSNTYPSAAILADFAAGLYVTAGPRWDLTLEQTGQVHDVLTYPLGANPLFATFFNVYTRNGQSLTDYIQSKLATTYQPHPVVSLIAEGCSASKAIR